MTMMTIAKLYDEKLINQEEINEILNQVDEYVYIDIAVCNTGATVNLNSLNDGGLEEIDNLLNDEWNGYDYVMTSEDFWSAIENMGTILEYEDKYIFVPRLK